MDTTGLVAIKNKFILDIKKVGPMVQAWTLID